jgi:hypothetical protein
MNEIRIKYDSISPRRQEIRDKVQLLVASLTIFLGYLETMGIYKGIAIVLPVIGFAIALLNILFIRFYRNFINRYSYKFEILLLRTNGIIMLITGIGYYFSGSKHLHYAYYLLTLIYFVILPYCLLQAKNKRILKFTQSKIIVIKKVRTVAHLWHNIDFIDIQKNVLKISEKGNKTIKKYFLEEDELKQSQLVDFIEDIKSKQNDSFDIRKS